MVALLGENTLLLMRASDRGQLVPQLLEDVQNMPREVKPGLVKVKVGSAPNQQGQMRFTLPSGQSFNARPTQPLPPGSTALIQIKPDGNPPQVLRVMVPSQNGQANMLQQTTSPSVLMTVAKQAQPRVGESLQLKPAPQQPATTAKTPPPRLPTPGAQVMGQVMSPPSGGSQNLLLANRTPLLLANPPVFEVGSNLTLRMTSASTAVLEKLNMPQTPRGNAASNTPAQPRPGMPANSSTQGNQPQGQQQNAANQAANQAGNQPGSRAEARMAYPSTQRPAPPAPAQTPQTPPQGVSQSGTRPVPPQQQVLFQMRPVSPTPPTEGQNPLPVTVSRVEQNTYTLRTENGLEFKVQPVKREAAQPQLRPQGQPLADWQSLQNPPGQRTGQQSQGSQQPSGQTTQQPTINTLTTGSNMSVRFTETGLMDVLQVAEPRNKLGPNPNQGRSGQGGNQTGQQGAGGQPSTPPQSFQAGHIATGTVTQQKPDGRLILTFDKGVTVEVQAQRLLPVGSKLSIQIMPDGHAEIIDMSLPRGSERSNTLMRYAVSWENLQNAAEELSRSNPEAHRKLVNTLPRANENLLPQLIQFSNAVAQQNLQAMLGDELVNVLRALGLDGMLQSDLSQMNAVQQQRADNPDSWRALLFPYWDDQEGQAKQGGFFWRRHHRDDAEDAAPDEGTLRFVLNVQMSELGHTQLDGLMQEHENLYLKLRTQQPLSDDEKTGLRGLVSKSLDALGLEGRIIIENVSFFEVDPLHDMLRPDGADGGEDPANQVNVEA